MFAVTEYLNSLSEDINNLNIGGYNLTELPDLSRFHKLKALYCHKNKLTSLPSLPPSLDYLCCSDNQISFIHSLPENLKYLSCCDNQLTSLPTLNKNLQIIQL